MYLNLFCFHEGQKFLVNSKKEFFISIVETIEKSRKYFRLVIKMEDRSLEQLNYSINLKNKNS